MLCERRLCSGSVVSAQRSCRYGALEGECQHGVGVSSCPCHHSSSTESALENAVWGAGESSLKYTEEGLKTSTLVEFFF